MKKIIVIAGAAGIVLAGLFILLSMPSASALSLPDTSSKTGLYIVDYGEAASYDPAFLANNFDVTIESTGLAPKVKAKNPNTVTLRYKEMNQQDTTSYFFTDWQEVNVEEEMFQHSTDPAGISFEPGNGSIVIYWQPDRRNTFPKQEDNSFALAGYNIYRSTSPNAGFSKINAGTWAQVPYADTGLTNGTNYYYQIKSVDSAGKEYNFSHVESSTPIASPLAFNIENANVSGSTNANGITTFNFSALAIGNPAWVRLYLDLNDTAKHTIEANEIFSMNNAGSGNYAYSVSLPLPPMFHPNANFNYKSGFAYYIQASDGTNTVRLPSSGTYTTNMNNRLKNPAFEGFLLEPGNAQSRAHYLDYIKKRMAEGYDGLFIDVVPTSNYYTTGGISDAMPENFNPAQFENDVKGFVAYMKQGLGSAPVTFNGLVNGTDLVTKYLTEADGAMDEEFVYSYWWHNTPRPPYYDEAGWKTRVNNIIQAGNLGKAAILMSHGDKSDTRGRMFAFASYLIAKGKNTYFYYTDKASYIKPNYYPEWRVALGKPTDSFTTLDGYQKQPGSGNYYQRQFEKGTALVNPTDNTISVPLSETYNQVTLTGDMVPELGGNGALTLVPANSLSLQAHSGAIILKMDSQPPAGPDTNQPNQINLSPPELLKAEAQSVYLERGGSYALSLSITNPSQENSADIALSASTSSSDIGAEFAGWNDNRKNISLAAGETTIIGVMINAESTAPNGTYTLTLRANYKDENGNDTNETKNISLQVNQNPQIQVSQLSSGVCANYGTAAVKVAIENNTPNSMNVYLTPESEEFLPRAKQSYLEMIPNSEKRVDIELSVPDNAVIGQSAQFNLVAKAGDTITKKKIYFSWVSCTPQQNEFTFNVAQPVLQSGDCLALQKNTAKTFTLRAYNLLNSTLPMQVSANGDLDFNLSETSLELPAYGYRESVLTAIPKSSNASGKYYFDIAGASKNQSSSLRVCFEVQPEHGIDVKAMDLNREIALGKMAVFGYEVQNSGDYNETVSLSVVAQNDIDTSLSDSVLAMKPHETKTIYLSISPKPNAGIGKRNATLRAMLTSTGQMLQKAVEFTVIEKPLERAQGTIQISSYPQTINLAQGEEKKLVVTITNPSAEAMRNIQVTIEGLPSNIYFPAVYLRELGAGQSAQLVGTIKAAGNAQAKNFQATMRTESDAYYAEVPVQLNIAEGRQASAGAGGLTGFLILFGKNGGAFLVAIALAIILFLYGLHLAKQRRESGMHIGRRQARKR